MREFVVFITHVYSTWWLSCESNANAPCVDLTLYKLLMRYRTVNITISESAVRAFRRHTWYLTAEMVVLALFGKVVPATERRALADALLTIKPDNMLLAPKNRFCTGFGKPRFQDITTSTKLADLVGEDSWFTICLLKLDVSFLDVEIETWDRNACFIRSQCIIDNLNVVNDCAERGVKLCSDFVSVARGEEHFRNVLQVIEHDRKTMPNLRNKRIKRQPEPI